MAYSSDIRVKELIKEAYRKANCKNLKIRWFGESHDDQMNWEDGGLTIQIDGVKSGSCDVGFYFEESCVINGKKINKKPVLLIEGTEGLEMGNTGSAQHARYSHALGPCRFGIIGVLLQAYEAKSGAKTRWDIFEGALIETKKSINGSYLVMDIYDEDLLVDFLKTIDKKNESETNLFIDKIITIMRSQYQKVVSRKRKEWVKDFPIKDFSTKIYLFNLKAFTTSGGRNGHTILGTSLNEKAIFDDKYAILFFRLNQADVNYLKNLKNNKEVNQMFNTKGLIVLNIDDLDFKNKEIEKELNDFKDVYPTDGKNAFKGDYLVNGVAYKGVKRYRLDLTKRLFNALKNKEITIKKKKLDQIGKEIN